MEASSRMWRGMSPNSEAVWAMPLDAAALAPVFGQQPLDVLVAARLPGVDARLFAIPQHLLDILGR